MRRSTVVAVLLAACFLLSGAAGLVYEVVWMRRLALVFGHTTFAVSTVLVAFMSGLALGAWLGGRLVDRWPRPLRIYAWLELGIAATALAVPPLLGAVERAYLLLYRDGAPPPVLLASSQLALVLLVLLPPTTLMGATLPAIARCFARRDGPLGRTVGHLYALNTLGAVLGCAAAGFALLPAIGMAASIHLAVAVNLLAGAIALVADRLGTFALADRDDPSLPVSMAGGPLADAPAPGGGALRAWLVLGGIGVSGATAMVYEVAWTRALTLVLGSSTYAFTAMLTTFLAGIALGSFVFARVWGRRRVGLGLLGGLEVGVSVAGLALIPVFGQLPYLVVSLLKRIDVTAQGALLSQFALSFLVMIAPTILLGAALPCAVQLCATTFGRVARDVGRVYAANTAGTIVGAVLAGFALVPLLGAQRAMLVAGLANATVGLVLVTAAAPARPWRRWAVAAGLAGAIGLVAVVPARWDPRVMAGGPSVYVKRFAFAEDPAALYRDVTRSRQILFHREGLNATVTVERNAQHLALRVDGKVDASTGIDMPTQYMLAHLPLLLHPDPQRVLVIGLGSGVTTGAAIQHPGVREVEVVELEPAVVEASRFFERENRGALRDPRVRLVIGDGRNVVLATSRRYDVISSEPSNPWMAGVGNLFSREFYEMARARLAPGGMMVQWVHTYSLFPRELRMILNTFRTVFPHATLWRTVGGDYLILGTSSPLVFDHAQVERRLAASPALRADLASLRLEAAVDLLALFLLGEEALARFADGAPLNTDDRPLLEFAAPLALHADTVEGNARLLREARLEEFPPVAGLPPGLLKSRRLRFASAHWAAGDKEAALEQIRKAGPASPGDVDSQMERAKLLFALGETAEASEHLAQLARRRPDDRLLASYLEAGTILREVRAEETLAHHSRTRFGDPNPAEAHNNLGVFYTRLGIRYQKPAFFDLAVDALESARRIEPEAYAVLNNLGNAYFELGRLDDAVRAYREVAQLAPREPHARFNLGLVYERQGLPAAAASEYEAALRLAPAWRLPAARLGQLQTGPPAAPASAGTGPQGRPSILAPWSGPGTR